MSKRILVLRGGPSSEFEVSLRSGKAVIDSLKEDFLVKDCVIDKQGVWHIEGVPVDPRNATLDIDVVFNAMHGEYGEDGTVQTILDNLGVKYTGANAFGSRIAMNKPLAKKIFSDFGLKTPVGIVVERNENIDNLAINIFRSLPMPVVIKPIDRGSSVGVSIARDFQSLTDTLRSLFVYHDKLLVEEYIVGKEATLGVIENFRDKEIYSLVPIEIRKPESKDFYDYEAKYTGISNYICPGNFSEDEKKIISEMAETAHKILGLRHYSRSDFIIHPRRGVYILETNSLPGLTNESLLPKGVNAVGSNLKDFLKHIVDLAK